MWYNTVINIIITKIVRFLLSINFVMFIDSVTVKMEYVIISFEFFSLYFFFQFRGEYRVVYLTPEFASLDTEFLARVQKSVGEMEVRLF